MPSLEIKTADRDSYRIPIGAGTTIRVGRLSTENEIVLSGDHAASRRHAEFTFDGESCTVTDLNSSNGTHIGGKAITEPTLVAPGTWVSIGRTRIRLVSDHEPEAKPPGPTVESVELAAGDSVMLSVSEIMNSVSLGAAPDPQLRAFATLSRAANELLAQRPMDEVLELVVNLVFDIATPDRGALMLLEGDPPALRAAASRGVTSAEGGLAISRTIADAVIRQQQAVMTTDAQMDDRFGSAESVIMHDIRSAMCVPLWNNKEVIGLIYVDTLGGAHRFSRVDLEALTLVANVAAVKIDNVRLFQQEQRMKEMERELRAAAEIQQRLLPAAPPELSGYELFGYNRPCFAVGGDYFDYLMRDERTLSFAIGDVSGKGLSAALLMASIQASFHAHTSTPKPVAELVSQLNRVVCRNSAAERFSTFFYGEVDIASGALRFCNAGHNPPLLVRAGDGSTELLSGGGMILGFDPDVPYSTHEARVEPGDLVVAYSDGVTESMNSANEEFGEERLIDAVRDCGAISVEQIYKRIDGAVDEFVGEADPFDDYTLVLLRRSAAK
jgi:serine phosphatase RsbU (regulator of sigma subunit)